MLLYVCHWQPYNMNTNNSNAVARAPYFFGWGGGKQVDMLSDIRDFFWRGGGGSVPCNAKGGGTIVPLAPHTSAPVLLFERYFLSHFPW